MSMDDVYERARALEGELEKFNDRLRGSFEEVMGAHGVVSPLWEDAMRREYDARWKPFEEAMQEYVERIGPKYVDILVERLRHLSAYLHGHGS